MCGIASVCLRKPLIYYKEKYKDPSWGLQKVSALLNAQRHRGQDGVGIAVVKRNMPPGTSYFKSIRSAKENSLEDVFFSLMEIMQRGNLFRDMYNRTIPELKLEYDFLGESYLGHLRYSTYLENSELLCQPFILESNIPTKSIALAGNFNMSNMNELFNDVISWGKYPSTRSDTNIILEHIAHYIESEHEKIKKLCTRTFEHRSMKTLYSQGINLVSVLKRASARWDGGYLFSGFLGDSTTFICRDPQGIRPGYYYVDDEVFAVASERSALTNVFECESSAIQEIDPGHVIIVHRNGDYKSCAISEKIPARKCVFERIYFSRGNDPDIYEERKALGKQVAPRVVDALKDQIEQAVFTYIPNSSEAAFFGLLEEVESLVRSQNIKNLWEKFKAHSITLEELELLSKKKIRAEKILHKNQKVRTFIAAEQIRSHIVSNLYDLTQDIVKRADILVAIDDSIVRGRTLKHCIVTRLSQLNPKKIIVVSSAPPIMYPDCYGIDMSRVGKFIAFQAAVALTKERGNENVLEKIKNAYSFSHAQEIRNNLKELYAQFTLQELEEKVSELARPKHLDWDGQLQVIYQTPEGLKKAIPNYTGDWYFTGDYPTKGGYKMAGRSFLQWYEGNDARAY